MRPLIKICGLNTAAAVDAALGAGATHAGFMYFEKSPRHVTLDDMRALAARTGAMKRVAVLVNRADAAILDVVAALSPDLLQLHGDETPQRVAAVRALTGLPVIKVLSVAGADDVAAAKAFGVADFIMFDAMAPKGADRPGGNGVVFDWALLKAVARETPWILSGGLNDASVAGAIARTGAPGVDVSSGVEQAPGVKSPALISAFTAALNSVVETWQMPPPTSSSTRPLTNAGADL